MKIIRIFSVLVVIFLVNTMLSSCNIADNVKYGKESNKKFYEGVIVDNTEMMNEALIEGADINKCANVWMNPLIPLWTATKNGMNARQFEYLVDKGADVNVPENNNTLLMYFASNIDVHFCDLLIKHGAKVNIENNGETALEYLLAHTGRQSAEKDIDQIVTLLLNNGAKIRPISLKTAMTNIQEGYFEYAIKKRILLGLLKAGYKSGLDPALEAAMLGDSKKLDELINQNKIKKADEQQILFFSAAFGNIETLKLLNDKNYGLDSTDKSKNTLLMVASCYGNLEIVKYLVNEGVNIDSLNIQNNKSALDVGIVYNQFEITEYLIKIGADLRLSTKFNDTIDVLREAIQNENIKMIQLILSSGYILDEKRRNDALGFATRNGSIEIAEYFLGIGADVNGKDSNGEIPLGRAYNLKTVEFLIEHGANVNGDNGSGAPIFRASEANFTDIAEYLIKKDADVNLISGGETPITIAIFRGHLDIVKLLVNNGANLEFQLDYKDSNNNTVIITAASCGSRNILDYIIKKGAKIDYQNEKGETALMVAAATSDNRRFENVKLLLQSKADKNLKNKDGKTALDLAKANNNGEIVDYLKSVK